jgi:ATP-dependent DNA helicase RecG
VENGNGTSRIEVPEIPVEAVREIVVNSFAHADYRGISENEIDITPTRVEIYNPGAFPAGLSPEMFARQRIRSMPRNKVILTTLYKSKDVEVFGSGFRKVYALCDKYDIKVESGFENDGFSFVFYRDTHQRHVTQNVTISVTDQDKDAKIPTDARVYLLLKEDPAQTRESLAQKTGRTVRTIQRALDKLSREGRIQRIGSNKTGYWEIF